MNVTDLIPFTWTAKTLEARTSEDFRPRINVGETEDHIKVFAEMPGMSRDDISVSLTSKGLTISGEKQIEQQATDVNYYHVERSYGSFQRTVALPEPVEPEQVEATFKDGVLTLVLPKSPEVREKPKQVTIK